MFLTLKRKLILVNMGLLTLVFVGIIATAAVLMIMSNERQTSDMLERALNSPFSSNLPAKPKVIPDRGNFPLMETISASIGEDGSVDLGSFPSQMNEQDVHTVVSAALRQNSEHGMISFEGYAFAYAMRQEDMGSKLVMIDQSRQRNTLLNTLLILLGVSVASLALLLALSIYFANRTVRPIKDAFEKQKNFIADASHELKTPLAIMDANISVLASNADKTVKSQQKWLDAMEEQSARMASLIGDMLTLAKLDSGKSEQPLVPVDMSRLLAGCLLSFEAPLFERGIRLSANIERELTVCGSREKLEQLIGILLDNAVKHTTENGQVTVTLCKAKERVLLSVKNDCEAIPQEALLHIFDRFYRIDSARTRESGGYGLGLAIAKSIVTELHAKISADSDTQSITFTVEFH